MYPVEISYHQGCVILRAKNTELLILPHHAIELKKLSQPKEFSTYFIEHALINRPARKLFESWLRKDHSLWPRLFKNIQDNVTVPTGEEKPALIPTKKVLASKPVTESKPTKASEAKKTEPLKTTKKAAKKIEEEEVKPAAKATKKVATKKAAPVKAKVATKKAAPAKTTKKVSKKK